MVSYFTITNTFKDSLPLLTVEGIPPTKIFFVIKSLEPAAPLGLISTYKTQMIN